MLASFRVSCVSKNVVELRRVHTLIIVGCLLIDHCMLGSPADLLPSETLLAVSEPRVYEKRNRKW